MFVPFCHNDNINQWILRIANYMSVNFYVVPRWVPQDKKTGCVSRPIYKDSWQNYEIAIEVTLLWSPSCFLWWVRSVTKYTSLPLTEEGEKESTSEISWRNLLSYCANPEVDLPAFFWSLRTNWSLPQISPSVESGLSGKQSELETRELLKSNLLAGSFLLWLITRVSLPQYTLKP